MTDELVGFEVAKLAKTKGFDEWCSIGWVTKEIAGKYLDRNYKYSNSQEYVFQKEVMFCPLYEPYYKRPTQSLLQRWLREKHDIDIWIQPIYLNKAIGSSVKTGYIINGGPSKEYDTYEQALEDALLTGLKLIE